MRNISAASLAKIEQRLGAEPYLIVGIRWDNKNEVLYGDRSSVDPTPFDPLAGQDVVPVPDGSVSGSAGATTSGSYMGKVLDISGLEDVTTVTGAGSSSNVTVLLDDTDGTIRGIISTLDPHMRPVTIYQTFEGITDKFAILEGQINTPIVWSEGERKISLSVVTRIEDRDIGFSAEEGDFPNLPDDAIGKVWPLAFGSPYHVPGLTFQFVPTGVTLTNILVPDRTLQMYETQQNRKVEAPGAIGGQLSLIYYYMALAAAAGDTSSAEAYNQQAIALQEAAQEEARQQAVQQQEMATYLKNYNQAITAMLDQLTGPVTQGSTVLMNNAKYFPVGVPFYARIGSFVAYGQVDTTGTFTFKLIQPPVPTPFEYTNDDKSPGLSWLVPSWTDADIYIDSNGKEAPVFKGLVGTGPHGEQIPVGYNVVQDITPEGVRIIPAGTQVTIISDVTMDYIVNIVPTQVTYVWAYKSVNNVRTLTLVPPQYWTQKAVNYSVQDDPTTDTPGTFTAQVVELKRPLSGYSFENWEDQIYVDQISSVGPNTVDVLIWLIQQYTTHGFDPAGFTAARAAVPDCHFYLDKRGNTMAVLSEIAYQAMLAIWLKNGTFFVAYLPGMPKGDADDTITEADIEVGSMEISCTATEELVTKYKATWTPDYAVDQHGVVIAKNNEARYGLIEQDVEYYVYRDLIDVQQACAYWISYLSTGWKKITFKTFLNHLNLETFDTVQLNFARAWVCGDPVADVGSPVNGLVESAVYDSVANNVTLTVWLPIPFGSMTSKTGTGGSTSIVTFLSYLATAFDAPTKPSFYTGSIAGLLPVVVGGGTKVNFSNFDSNWLNNVFKGMDAANAASAAAFEQAYNEAYQQQLAQNSADLQAQGTQDQLDNDQLQQWGSGTRAQQLADSAPFPPPKYQLADSFKKPEVTPATPPSVYPGKVVSKEGSEGNETYTVTVYKLGTANDGSDTPGVQQLQISPTDTIPAGTWCLVVVVPDKKGVSQYYMQIPVWLA